MNRFDANDVGPGSYNINSEFHQKSAVLPNPPRFLMPKGQNSSNLFISKSHNTYRLGRCSPESNHNNPNFDVLFHKTISAKFGVSKRIDYFTSAQFRSPGPIYSLPKYKSPSTSFGRHKGGSSQNMTRKMIKTYKGTSVCDTRKLFDKKDNLPGPGAYCVNDGARTAVLFGRASKEIDVRTCKEYLDRKSKEYLSSF